MVSDCFGNHCYFVFHFFNDLTFSLKKHTLSLAEESAEEHMEEFLLTKKGEKFYGTDEEGNSKTCGEG